MSVLRNKINKHFYSKKRFQIFFHCFFKKNFDNLSKNCSRKRCFKKFSLFFLVRVAANFHFHFNFFSCVTTILDFLAAHAPKFFRNLFHSSTIPNDGDSVPINYKLNSMKEREYMRQLVWLFTLSFILRLVLFHRFLKSCSSEPYYNFRSRVLFCLTYLNTVFLKKSRLV